MYYAFFKDKSQSSRELLELRGLGPGRFHVVDYENGRDYGTLEEPAPRLAVNFREHLLLEVSKAQP
jgi:alpha-galactosidase